MFFFFGRDVQQPVAVAEIFVRQPDFFRAEQKSNSLRLQILADRAAGDFVEPAHRKLQSPIAHCRRPYNQRAVGDGLSNGLKFFRAV